MNSLKGKLMNLSTMYKILIANSFIIVVGAIVGTWLTQELSRRSVPELITIFVLIGIILSILLNFFILKAAFLPLTTLYQTVDAVYHGDLTARAVSTSVSDPIINRLTGTLNSMLEELSTSYKRLEELYQELRKRDRDRSELLAKIITIQEEERNRIARELHDELGQTLTGIVMSLGSAEALLLRNPAARQRLQFSRCLATKALEEVRRVIGDLRPSLLDDLGLAAAIDQYAVSHLVTAGVKPELETQGLDQRLPGTLEITVFRVVQEAITNVVKHARAKTASIGLQATDSTIVGSIKDDGVGFNVNILRRDRRNGLGLLGMEERISLLGGKLNIESQPGGGTHVHFEIPWQESRGEQNSPSYS